MFSKFFFIVWNDIEPAIEEEYIRWHRVEHMPERLATEGFDLGRRYADSGADLARYLTLYEVESAEVFASPVYMKSLASPTEWTRRISPNVRNFVRRVCRTIVSEAVAIGGTVMTFRLRLPESGHADDAWAFALVESAIALDGVVGAHVGRVDSQLTALRTDKLQAPVQTRDTFDAVLVVETGARKQAVEIATKLRLSCAKASLEIAGDYIHDLSFLYRPSWRRPDKA